MRVLLYYPSNKRTVAIETVVLEFHRRGVPIELLTTCEPGALHDYLESRGIRTHTNAIPKGSALVYYLRQMVFLVRFCRAHGITTVFSNLQHVNFIAVFAQFFTTARMVIFRHHFKFSLPGDGIPLEPNRMERVFDAIINRLGREIIVPSTGVYEGMRIVEGADMTRVRILPYIYDFDQYGEPDSQAVADIRARYPARLRLLMSSRLIPYKRHALAFKVLRNLVRSGHDIVCFVLDEGPERASLEAFVREEGLQDHIIFLGFRTDFLDWMGAADLLVHPSLTEASSSVVKEMALLGKTSMVCQGVGDFDEYLEHGRNAFVVPRSTDGSHMEQILREVHADPEMLTALGASLQATVLSRFGHESDVVLDYLELARRQG